VDPFFALPEARRRQIFEEAGGSLGLPATSIEKDWWVTAVLEVLFTNDTVSPWITFKGGTSLSKAFKLIQRFSEDIDLVIDRGIIKTLGDQTPETSSSNKERKKRVRDYVTFRWILTMMIIIEY